MFPGTKQVEIVRNKKSSATLRCVDVSILKSTFVFQSKLIPVKRKEFTRGIHDVNKKKKIESTMDIKQFLSNNVNDEDSNSCQMFGEMLSNSPMSPRSSISSDHDYVLAPNRMSADFQHWEVDVMEQYTNSENFVKLEIIVEPVEMFRFRYRSEMSGTHGSLLGRPDVNEKNRKKTHPTVKLVNYTGQAKIYCVLVQNEDSVIPKVHAHTLVTKFYDDKIEEPCEVSVGLENDYTAKFTGMAIVQSAKKKVAHELYMKRIQIIKKLNQNQYPLSKERDTELKIACNDEVKNMNMNSVRLCFCAYDQYNKQICNPVLSQPIDNLKSAETGALKIVRMSKTSGSVRGGEEIFMFVEKVSKKNIKVKFYELDGNSRIWERDAKFSESDVHHQFGIVFSTPPYRNLDIRTNAKVFVQLYRPKDEAVSDPKSYEYMPSYYNKRKRAAQDSISQLNSMKESTSMSEGEVFSSGDLPLTVTALADKDILKHQHPERYLEQCKIHYDIQKLSNISLSHPVLNSSLEAIERDELIFGLDSTNIINYHCSSFDENFDSIGRSFPRTMIDAPINVKAIQVKEEKSLSDNEENNLYSTSDTKLADKALKTIKSIIKTNPPDAAEKLLSLLDVKLQDGDSFFHYYITCGMKDELQTLLELVNNYNLYDVINYTNNKGETPLHISIMSYQNDLISMLLEAGSDPNILDDNGNTPLHLSVIEDNSECMVQLLHKKNYNTEFAKPLDVELCNNEGWTALHLAAMRGSLASLSRLVLAGANVNTKGKDNGRSALHLAVANEHSILVSYLLKNTQVDVNAEANCGLTALHLASTLKGDTGANICELLLKYNADPLKKCNEMTVYEQAMTNTCPKILAIFRKLRPHEKGDVDSCSSVPEKRDIEIKEEPCDMPFLDSQTTKVVAQCLDQCDKWKNLAEELGFKDLISLYETSKLANPSSILLNLIEAQEKVTLQELYEALVKLDLSEAADAVKHIIKD